MNLRVFFPFLVALIPIFLFSDVVYCLDLEKVDVYVDKEYLNIKIWGQGEFPKDFEKMIKNNIDFKVIVSVKILRRDFKPLNIVTEVTNYRIVRQVSYDLVTENFLVFDGIRFRLASSLEEVPKNIFPLVIRQKISDLKELPDLSTIYNDTDFVVVAKMRISSLELRPPLSIIASILNLVGWEGREMYSDPFLIR
jgi:hypothetical protein